MASRGIFRTIDSIYADIDNEARLREAAVEQVRGAPIILNNEQFHRTQSVARLTTLTERLAGGAFHYTNWPIGPKAFAVGAKHSDDDVGAKLTISSAYRNACVILAAVQSGHGLGSVCDMRWKWHDAEEIIKKLAKAKVFAARGLTSVQIAEKLGVSDATFRRWRKLYGGLTLDQVRHVQRLESENLRMRRVIAELEGDTGALTWGLDPSQQAA